MKKAITPLTALPPTGMGTVDKAWDAVSVSFDRFCLTAGIEALGTMMEQDAEQACGVRHARSDGRRGHRWGRTQGKIGFHAGKVAVERPRVRDLAGRELARETGSRRRAVQCRSKIEVDVGGGSLWPKESQVSAVSGASCGNPYWGYRHADKSAKTRSRRFPTLPTSPIETVILQAFIDGQSYFRRFRHCRLWRRIECRKCGSPSDTFI